MKSHRVALVFLVLTITLCGIMAGSQMAIGEETVSENAVKDIRATDNNTTVEEKTTLEGMVENLFTRIFGIFGDIIDFIVMVVTAPFRAWANIWSGWGSSFGSWYGPLLGTLVVIGVIFMISLYSRVNRALNKR